MHAPTRSLAPRKEASTSTSSSSSSSSFSCSGKNSSDPRCEKPASSNGLEIGLGVGIPVFVILCVMAFFMAKNYRKEKREASERDPDFDEHGDATALPDFPAFAAEDPFQTRGSVHMLGANGGYPFMHMPNKSANDLGSASSPTDAFVLPYQNQLGSKASLHEFARNSADMRLYHQRRGSEYSTFTGLASAEKTSPVKGKRGITPPSAYGNLPDTDASGESGTSKSSQSDPPFGVQYENESKMAINSTLPSSRRSFALSAQMNPDMEVSDADSVTEDYLLSEEAEKASGPAGSQMVSPFEDTHEDLAAVEDMKTKKPQNSQSSGSIPRRNEAQPAEPRISQFDMLRNVSDDENDETGENDKNGENPGNFSQMRQKNMSPEQEEELARMKSVYKVYFDRSNSVASQKEHDASHGPFQADASQPLPSLDPDHLKINNELKGDTAYDRRKTATSSIYEEGMDGPVVHPYQKFNVPGNAQSGISPPQNVHTPINTSFEETVRSSDDLLPLKSLPHASDIRNSTLETYTLYQPSLKISSPSLRQQQGYFDGSEPGSPNMASQASFGHVSSPRAAQFGELPPTIRENNSYTHGTTPSPSQLSRTSVVMLNPVSEITSSRKFKPAGSLPSGMMSPQMGHNDEFASGDDLIPGNRKSAVRRMMNTNF